jgi:hypothetical protein
MPDSLARSSALTVQLHSLAIEGKLAISTVAPCSQKSRKWLGFPDPDDGPAYGDRSWSLLDKWYPPSRCHVDLAELQRYVCAWTCDYTQVCVHVPHVLLSMRRAVEEPELTLFASSSSARSRRWLIIATPDEMATCAALDGVRDSLSLLAVHVAAGADLVASSRSTSCRSPPPSRLSVEFPPSLFPSPRPFLSFLEYSLLFAFLYAMQPARASLS